MICISFIFCFLFLNANAASVDSTVKKIAIYWDTSFSMGAEERLTDEEIDLVSEYLKALGDVDVKVVGFSMIKNKVASFEVRNGVAKAVTDYLKKINYEGGTCFDSLFDENEFKVDTVLLFTDGNTIFEKTNVIKRIPVFCINSQENGDHKKLTEIAEKTGSKYILLDKLNFEKGLSVLLGKNTGEIFPEKEEYFTLTGFVTDTLGVTLQGAIVNVPGTYVTTITDKEGAYSIRVNENDEVCFNYPDKEEQIIELKGQQTLNVALKPKRVIIVGEVLVKGKRKRKKETLMTPYGRKDKASIGYAYQEIKSEDIKPGYVYLSHILAGKPGIEVKNYQGKTYFIISKNKSSSILWNKPPIIVVDGNIYEQPTQPQILATNIENIVIRNTLAGTNIYGSDGAFGAIEITTKGNHTGGDVVEKASPALVQGNIYDGEATEFEKVNLKIEDLEAIGEADNFEEAYKIYNSQKRDWHPVPYFVDVSDYFLKWNKSMSLAILLNIMEIASTDMSSMRVLAFKLEERGENELAQLVYEYIARTEPKRIQSYRDIALAYSETGRRDEASELYRKMNYNLIEGINFSKIDKVLSSETSHFVKISPPTEVIRVPMAFFDRKYKTDIRLVFEWSIPNVEFELQFVNPQNKFFKWEHTLTANKERVLDETESGYQVEEFILDEGETGGEWVVNLFSYSDVADRNPAYLKYTLYKHYGLPDEEKIIKVLKLNTLQKNITIDKFIY